MVGKRCVLVLRRGSALLVALVVCSLWAAGVVSAAPGHGLDARPVAGARQLRLQIRPAVGRRASHFVVSFTAGLTGFNFPDSTSYRVVASGGSSRTCRSVRYISVAPTTPGQRIHVTLTPSGRSGLWCPGRYTGRLQELFQPACAPRQMCPLMTRVQPSFIVVKSLQTFHFRVR